MFFFQKWSQPVGSSAGAIATVEQLKSGASAGAMADSYPGPRTKVKAMLREAIYENIS